jgi:hypothetical protein
MRTNPAPHLFMCGRVCKLGIRHIGWPEVRELRSISFSYIAAEDRILTIVNPGDPEAWSCWLTRRLVLALFERTENFLASTSSLMKQVPAGARYDLIDFEREAAMAITAKAISKTPDDAINASASMAELAQLLTISSRANKIRVELRGKRGGTAAGLVTRAELQRILRMLQVQVVRAGWLSAPAKPLNVSAHEEKIPKPFRH